MTLVFRNATLVLPDRLEAGSLIVEDGTIAGIGEAARGPSGVDCDGDYLLPGAIDLHTDNLERQVQPRGGVRWPSRSALVAHDAQCAAAGITTVLDALCIGDLGFDEDRLRTCADGIADLDALGPSGLLKADHFLHLRCELPAMGMLDQLERSIGHPLLRLVSLMDHTPGIGQYADIERYQAMRLRDGEAEEATQSRIAVLQAQRERLRDANRAGLLARFAGSAVAIASHDDRTSTEVEENLADGLSISEFPVTMEAARAAKAGGMQIIAGSPNVVRGRSHNGNVAAIDLIRAGLVDALASDYVPTSLMEAAFAVAATGVLSLPRAVRLVTAAPAVMAGLSDRGAIAPGLRADLVRVRLHDGLPIVRAVWRRGERVI